MAAAGPAYLDVEDDLGDDFAGVTVYEPPAVGAHKRHEPQDVYRYIVEYKTRRNGNSPSLLDICAACDIASKSTARYLVRRLELAERIRITSRRGQPLAIEVPGSLWIAPPEPGGLPVDWNPTAGPCAHGHTFMWAGSTTDMRAPAGLRCQCGQTVYEEQAR